MIDLPSLDTLPDDGRLRRIVIVGGGSAGWMAAAGLSRATKTPIVLVESDAIGTVGVGEATIPQIRTFNHALGLDEREFVRETKGTFKLGIRFVGWNGEGSDYMHAFGQVGQRTSFSAFHQLWLRARSEGYAGPLSDYSLNEIAARAGKMAMPGAGLPQQGYNMPWAYHFDASLYAQYLRRLSEADGVTRIEGTVADVRLAAEGKGIESIVLESGYVIEGDLFLDCTGFRGLLISKLEGSDYSDWRQWLPCDSAQAVPCEAAGPIEPYTTSTAHSAGWQWRIPLQHRVGNGIVYCSDFMSDEDANSHLIANLESQPTSEPRQIRFRTGTRERHWIGNCLALGLSAGFLEPLESTSIHLIQYSVARLLAMLPRREIEPAIQASFNHEITRQWLRIRDFLILHYWANGRVGEEFWDARRNIELPDTLNAKIEQFRSAGHFVREEEELFTEVGWVQVFIGQGILPQTWSPLVDEIDAKELRQMLENMSRSYQRLVASAPPHDEFVSRFANV